MNFRCFFLSLNKIKNQNLKTGIFQCVDLKPFSLLQGGNKKMDQIA